MWNRISIRWQLLALLTLAILLIEISTLMLDFQNDIKQRKLLAVEQAETVSRSLQLDMLKAIISPSADSYSDITFRISNYPSIYHLSVFNNDRHEVFRYASEGAMDFSTLVKDSSEEPLFADSYLRISRPIVVDNHTFGDMTFVFDLMQYNTGLHEQLVNKAILFAIQLSLALLLAWIISRNYTRPFSLLADTMQQANIRQGKFKRIETTASNEIGQLYDGYNSMIARIISATHELQFQSRHDSLTGLLNRLAIDELIVDALGNDKISSNVLILLDIDQFKLVNDTSGHVAGDELLKQLGQVLTSSLTREHALARIGGDDFTVLLSNCDTAHGEQQARLLLNAVSEFSFNWNQSIHSISCSVGLVAFMPGEYTPKALNIALETAFYSAKSMGQNRLSVYKPDDENIRRHNTDLQTMAIVRDALKRGGARFELYAQSITPLQKPLTGISYEILIRLIDADGKMVYPDLFLPAANRFQLMVDIDIYVLWEYLDTVANYPAHVEKLDFVNINLGGSTLTNPDFQNSLREAIEHFDFPWKKLVLEVTETSAVGNLPQAREFICYCREQGIRVALDDFGTGMASFEYLKHLPLDVVKIDGSFVRDMLTDPIDNAMVSYACEISKLQGRETIAEFVEEKAHFDRLTEIGVDYAQGYYLDKPRPLSQWINS
jgi:diguanylate cyclase (GGDEF)-like protein